MAKTDVFDYYRIPPEEKKGESPKQVSLEDLAVLRNDILNSPAWNPPNYVEIETSESDLNLFEQIFGLVNQSDATLSPDDYAFLISRELEKSKTEISYLSSQLEIDEDTLTRSYEAELQFLNNKSERAKTDKNYDINTAKRDFRRNLRSSREQFVDQRQSIRRGYADNAVGLREGLASSAAGTESQLRQAGLGDSSLAELAAQENRNIGQRAISGLRRGRQYGNDANDINLQRNQRNARESFNEGVFGINRQFEQRQAGINNSIRGAGFGYSEGQRQLSRGYLSDQQASFDASGRYVQGLDAPGGFRQAFGDADNHFFSRANQKALESLNPNIASPVIDSGVSLNHPLSTYREPEVSPYIGTERRKNTRPDNQPR